MDIWSVLVLSVGLAADAFAVSLCKGLAVSKITLKAYLSVGLWFGMFQGIMPFAGFLLGSRFAEYVNRFCAPAAFIILACIGANMLKESFSKNRKKENASFSFKIMFVMALATSVDAMAVGISFALIPPQIIIAGEISNTVVACALIAVLTALISSLGLKIGNIFGLKFKSGAEFAGGIILILIGIKILIEYIIKK